jgi:hypothetical protein
VRSPVAEATRDRVRQSLVRTARAAGLWYLGLAVTGAVGFLLIRPRLFFEGDPSATLAELVAQEPLARAGIALELGIVITQVLAALWFYRLFRPVDRFVAGTLVLFGTVNAVAILASAAFLATALDVALAGAAAGGGTASLAHLMYLVSGNLWGVAAVFFGLWLIPMGWLVRRSGWMPRLLGVLLMIGGVGYLLSAFVSYLLPEVELLADVLTIPATVGELWIIGYLLIYGVRSSASIDVEHAAGSAAAAP